MICDEKNNMSVRRQRYLENFTLVQYEDRLVDINVNVKRILNAK